MPLGLFLHKLDKLHRSVLTHDYIYVSVRLPVDTRTYKEGATMVIVQLTSCGGAQLLRYGFCNLWRERIKANS